MLLVDDATKLPLLYSRYADKSKHYTTGGFGEHESIFNVRDSTVHAKYRKIAAAPYSVSNVRKMEPLIDVQIKIWTAKLQAKFAETHEALDFSQWAVYFAFDVISSFGFGAPFGFIEQEKDVGGLIEGFHHGVMIFGVLGRLYPFTEWVKRTFLGKYLVATPQQKNGIGALMRFRDDLVAKRYKDIAAGTAGGRMDLLQT